MPFDIDTQCLVFSLLQSPKSLRHKGWTRKPITTWSGFQFNNKGFCCVRVIALVRVNARGLPYWLCCHLTDSLCPRKICSIKCPCTCLNINELMKSLSIWSKYYQAVADQWQRPIPLNYLPGLSNTNWLLNSPNSMLDFNILLLLMRVSWHNHNYNNYWQKPLLPSLWLCQIITWHYEVMISHTHVHVSLCN